ncbi:MAG: peptidase S41 [Acidobacteria bacterium]|nr:peptidase S41 [Acidobacteriota bacterium]
MTLGLFRLVCCAILLLASLPAAASAPSREIQNLRAFAKLYGYVRFFHPSDEASAIDWDRFAIHGAARVKAAADDQELQQALDELFRPLAPTLALVPPGADFPALPETTGDRPDAGLVACQHNGVWLGYSPAYKSVRLNRETTIRVPSPSSFGTVTQAVDATAWRGRLIRLTARVRAEVTGAGNQGQLWLRVDRPDNQRGFFDNMADRPITAAEWTTYHIEGSVADDASQIFLGCFLLGAGKVWVDDVRLEQQTDGGEWTAIPLTNGGFEGEVKEDRPTGWAAVSPGYQYRVTGEQAPEGQRCLMIKRADAEVTLRGPLFDARPEPGECITADLGGGLRGRLPLTLPDRDGHTRPAGDAALLQQLAEHLNRLPLPELTADREDVRLGDVVITWNVFQHFYPYFDRIDTDWDAELTRALQGALADQTPRDFYRTLCRLVAALHDGHGSVLHALLQEEAGFPIRVEWIENQAVVTVTQDPGRFQVGDIIDSVDGTPAADIIAVEETLLSGSPQWKRKQSCATFAFGPRDSMAKLRLRRGGESLTVECPRTFRGYLPEPRPDKITELAAGIWYVNLDQAAMPEINAVLDRLAVARGVIFDLRGYPKGNHEIISHLIDQPVQSAKWNIPQVIYPDRQRPAGYDTDGRWTLDPHAPRLTGKIVFLTDGRAISYAESVMGIIEHYRLGEIVGQTTAGTNGNVNPFPLPGGFRIVWTGMKVLKHDDSPHHLVGIRPTVPVTRTLAAVREGRDEFLETALGLIKQAAGK